jgi:hypothetical protein
MNRRKLLQSILGLICTPVFFKTSNGRMYWGTPPLIDRMKAAWEKSGGWKKENFHHLYISPEAMQQIRDWTPSGFFVPVKETIQEDYSI